MESGRPRFPESRNGFSSTRQIGTRGSSRRRSRRTPRRLGQPSDEQAEEALSIAHRLGDWRTIVSFGFALLVLVFVIVKGNIDPSALWHRIKTLNFLLFGAAFLVYYLSFPIRGYRWKVLLENAYHDADSERVQGMTIRGLSEIIYISWFVNCVVRQAR